MKRNKVLYLEIAKKIREDIFAGKYKVGTMLPTESELEALFNVSKITIRKAIELLASDEYVEKKSGKGTKVLSDRPYNKLSKAVSFTQLLKASNEDIKKVFLSAEKVVLEKGDQAYDLLGEHAVLLQRLYMLSNQPYIYFKYYLPSTLLHITDTEFKHVSLYQILRQNGYLVSAFEDAFSAVLLTEKEQEMMATEALLGMKRTRKSYDEKGDLCEYSEAIYLTEQHPYVITYET